MLRVVTHSRGLFTLEWTHPAIQACLFHGIKLVRPLSTVDNTRDYARVSHSRQWSNYNVAYGSCSGYIYTMIATILVKKDDDHYSDCS